MTTETLYFRFLLTAMAIILKTLLLRPIIILLLTVVVTAGASAESLAEFKTLRTSVVGPLKDGGRIGRIQIHGMLELPNITVDGHRFTQLSALAWDEDDDILYAVSDKGALFWLRPVINNRTLVDLQLIKAVRLYDINTGSVRGKRGTVENKPLRGGRIDAEGMEILNGRNGINGDAQLLISFERFPRIVGYSPEGFVQHDYPLPKPLNKVNAYRSRNKMLEGVCRSPVHGILTAPEAPLRSEQKNMTRIFNLHGKSWPYLIHEGSHIVSLESFGKDGVLILERDFRLALGHTVITLKKIASLPKVPQPSPVASQTMAVLDSKSSLLLDNFEGLAKHDGNYYFMISDNNDIFLQRTLLLYFELMD